MSLGKGLMLKSIKLGHLVKRLYILLYVSFSFLQESYNRVKGILTSRRGELEKLAEALLKYGTLEKDEVFKVIKGQKINREVDAILKDRNITT